ncbi:MAG TPA: cytidylate kinase-like family protein [bacterium]|nr:cytidylate kinase-like family protein [bacterium]
MTSIEALIDRQLTRRQLLERAQLARPPAGEVKPARLRVITVSRETGSGGRTLAGRLAQALKYEFIDRQIVDQLVEDTGARERLIASLDERTRNGVVLWVEGILTGRYIDRSEYTHALCKTITTLAEHGDAVILGRGANVILGPRGGLHVRVVAPPEMRVQNLMRHMGMTPRQAQEHVKLNDEDRRRFYADVLHADIDNPNDYHMVINTGRVSLDVAQELVLLAWEKYLKS